MSSISIIGLGTMARTIATRALAGGNSIQLIGRDTAKTTALANELGGEIAAAEPGESPKGEIVILAVPYGSAVSIVSRYGDALAGKILVDISNPFDSSRTDLVSPRESSAAQEIAKAAAPAGALVVKAFNTLMSTALDAAREDGRALDVFIAGDDADAKASVSSFIESLGLRPLDTGDLKFAHWLEGAGLLVLGQAVRTRDFTLTVKIA
jgi:hypothetical protein